MRGALMCIHAAFTHGNSFSQAIVRVAQLQVSDDKWRSVGQTSATTAMTSRARHGCGTALVHHDTAPLPNIFAPMCNVSDTMRPLRSQTAPSNSARRVSRVVLVSRSFEVRARFVSQSRHSYTYAELVQSYERIEAAIASAKQHSNDSTSTIPLSSSTGSSTGNSSSSDSASKPLYISDPAVYTNPKIMAKQIQNTLGQVVSAGKLAVDEILTAIDPRQHQQQQQSGDVTSLTDQQRGRHRSLHSHPLSDISPEGPIEQLPPHKPKPQPLKAVGKQAARLTQAIAEDVHDATQDAYHKYGPHITAAGVRLVGAGAAALGVEVIGPTSTARAIQQLGSTNAAAATEELGAAGVLKVTKRLGPVGLYKILVKLGPRGIMNLASHVTSRMADSVRAHAARLNPDQPEADLQVEIEEITEGMEDSAAGVRDEITGQHHHHHHHHHQHSKSHGSKHSSRSGSVSNDGSGRADGRLPGVALAAALIQLLLLALAGILQTVSNLLNSGVKLWDRMYKHRKHDDSLSESSDADTAAVHDVRSSVRHNYHEQHKADRLSKRQQRRQVEQASVYHDTESDMFGHQVQAAAPQQGSTQWHVQGG